MANKDVFVRQENATSDFLDIRVAPQADSVLAFDANKNPETILKSTLSGGGAGIRLDSRGNVAMTANGTTTINTTANGTFDTISATLAFTGGTTETNTIDIINASEGKFYTFIVTRDGTAGTKTLNFAGSGRTFNRSWISGTLTIPVNSRFVISVRAASATVFDVFARQTL